MRELKEPCKSAIEKGLCLGCTGLAERDWVEPKHCPYRTTVEDCIRQIHKNLGMGEQMRL